MRPLIIGEAPGRGAGGALEGRCGETLAAFCGLDVKAFRRSFALVNLLRTWPGSAGKGAAFDLEEARRLTVSLRRRVITGRVVLLLGKRVGKAFGLKPVYFDRQDLYGAEAYVIPHPSGVNRWYNSNANAVKMSQFMWNLCLRNAVAVGREIESAFPRTWALFNEGKQ